jgi:hypothetical protein
MNRNGKKRACSHRFAIALLARLERCAKAIHRPKTLIVEAGTDDILALKQNEIERRVINYLRRQRRGDA